MTVFSDYYGMPRNVFDKNQCTEEDCFSCGDHKKTIARLEYLVKTKGIGVITARPGLGKTYSIRCFVKSLNHNLYTVRYMCLSTVSVMDFYKGLCALLGVGVKGGKSAMFKALQEQIWYMYKEKGQPLVLVIDEAQYLCTEVLMDLKLLMNQNYDSVNCFTLILCGEPHLYETLRRPVHEALNQRIFVRYNYKGLEGEEAGEYIRHKIIRSGASRDIISESAINAVQGYTHGNPRLIDNIMTDAINIGGQIQKNVIDEEVIMAAAINQDPFMAETV